MTGSTSVYILLKSSHILFSCLFPSISSLAKWCNSIAMSSVICLSLICLSVTRVYRDKTAEGRIMQFSLKCSPVPQSLPAKHDDKIHRNSLDRGSNWGGVVFDRLRDAISETVRD